MDMVDTMRPKVLFPAQECFLESLPGKADEQGSGQSNPAQLSSDLGVGMPPEATSSRPRGRVTKEHVIRIPGAGSQILLLHLPTYPRQVTEPLILGFIICKMRTPLNHSLPGYRERTLQERSTIG